ncbi:hypothetical protein BOW53_02970 [Solemya pervernicosa gill symbiont]|uniref:Uncharacterized protein n=1 Tax=Solemya pervernicosa gill symbiont TaxID=642797 RepID=A0A1T2L9P8_9GAMM|nr:hypothetical protein [Solemya pervernicosa gill symbiont]OOZ41656.1 hypothetical protein BOW53_02970 [Solemya pervernicosa gill symbiont]
MLSGTYNRELSMTYSRMLKLVRGIAVVCALSGTTNLVAADLCFSCTGLSYVAAIGDQEALEMKDRQASICMDKKTLKITHLSAGAHGISGYSMSDHHPEEMSVQGYYYWESDNTYNNWRFKEDLKIYVEFSDIQYHLQVVNKNKSKDVRLSYNGRCRPSKRLKDD